MAPRMRKFKHVLCRSEVNGAIPENHKLERGEIAINVPDKIIYYKAIDSDQIRQYDARGMPSDLFDLFADGLTIVQRR